VSPRAPAPLRWLLAASLALAVFPAAFAVHYTGWWRSELAGRSDGERRAAYDRLPWFQPDFLVTVERLRQVLPEDAGVLVRPVLLTDRHPKARWYLPLSTALYPRRVHVREPALASGIAADYQLWLDANFERLGADERRTLGTELRHRARPLSDEESAALVERDVHWLLDVPTSRDFDPAGVRLSRRSSGGWVEVPLGRGGGRR
jgi:hypothetical protein